ncbi:MAG: CPBP family intramembrane metalloprotease [Gemmatimonadota bacterium]|nr:CPBP family intramembrane metalloprotease [Gemmatimonadota bacterium]MDH3367904.1 CPBP family intramembrane metalloprotease [Gemmatimonadota bacterium]MDH3477998.1 CPBP family intramembrane metalloprotease [Gemmatimonadota bacterium]MDH3570424.1 CPBP family intramembrane metalloprotease [Gemmatimonadota bacterium]MDH5549050.1 CPBP family intramembrane metalloprotease [Gemmatimonadota bacterium]
MTTSESSVHHRARTPILLVTATVVLALLYYFGRADTIGVLSGDRGWQVMTPGVRSARLHYLLSAVLLGIVPLVVARFACGIRLRELGLGLGRWREGLVWLAIGVPLAVLAGKIAAGQSAMQAVYPLDPTIGPGWEFLPYAVAAFLYFGSWEILFRSVLLFGLAPSMGGTSANAVQTGLAVTAHFGRALNEVFSALPASFVFGYVTLRVRSIWYVALIHWTVAMSMEWFILTG